MKSTQDTLNSCRDAGVLFGQALADALTLPLTAFNKLRSGIDWVLEKLGVINKESGTLDKTAAKANAAAQSGGYVPAASAYGGYQPYPAPQEMAQGYQPLMVSLQMAVGVIRVTGLSPRLPGALMLTRAKMTITSTCRAALVRGQTSTASCRMRSKNMSVTNAPVTVPA